MRRNLNINLKNQSVDKEEIDGEDVIVVGRHLIAKTLLERNIANIEALSPDNPLIFSAGPFAGSNFSNANRLSVGCKSPLTGGVKEANSGGTFAFAMGQLEISGITLNNASEDWVVIYITKDDEVKFEDASPYLGKGNFEAAGLLFEKYGDKVSLGICGPVGEYGGLISGISFTDPEQRPTRIAARGGVGAVMGSKKVKAIVIDRNKMPSFHDRKKVMCAVREYGKRLDDDAAIESFRKYGTAMVADFTNKIGGLPTRNFSDGTLVNTDEGIMKLGGNYIRDLNLSRGGEPTHACMPGCLIQCSNVYMDKDGNEMCSPVEYETLGLMGSNCGLEDPDDVALLNNIANDLGVDTIEVGAMLGVMMEAGEGSFGDPDFMANALEDIRRGTERGKILAQGTERVGIHYGVNRIPTVKKQGISAYDPRVIEVTGIYMMVTAQGADHTTGNIPAFECDGKTTEELVEASLEIQTICAAADSLGICLFGRTVTNKSIDFIVDALNEAHGTKFDESKFMKIGREALEMEWRFNKDAGFTDQDDEMPDFFFGEALAPSGKKQRHKSADVNKHLRTLINA